ncbi:four helix bundle protein [Candidatus Altiarchaeota archaeon]
MAQNFHNLEVYQNAYSLSVDIYKALQDIRGEFRLKDQITGAASSIGANLAEMGSMDNKNQQRQKVITCLGEANELEHWLNYSREIGLITESDTQTFLERLITIRKQLFGLMKAIERG